MRIVLVSLALAFSTVMPAQAADQPLTVMSRNLYLGADVGVAMELIPDFSAAAQFMWNQVAATDFTLRAPALAKEVIAQDADVVGLQEATHWYCKKNLWSKKVVIFDFTKEFLDATKAAGSQYVLASKGGTDALNIGYSIPAVPYLTMVEDPKSFQPIFGSDKAACGFEIGDAIVVKKELADQIIQVGNTEYDASYTIIPKLMTIYRGYTWIDFAHNGSKVRIVSTHLESLWDSNKVPNSALQATQLIGDLANTKMPTIVIGDFNSDPRDPRPVDGYNPGGQPEASETCLDQGAPTSVANSLSKCNAYWQMRQGGFEDAGPDARDPKNYTWGMSALLAGPDAKRYKAAKLVGNDFGFTDRLDYIFFRNGVKVVSSKIVGNTWPQGSTWDCSNEEQVNNAAEIAGFMKIEAPARNFCNDTDHASVVAKVSIPTNSIQSEALPDHAPFPITFWNWVGIVLLISLSGIIYLRRRRK
jgi:Endonuclease/Exonuclease/phosphatase family